MRTYHVSDNKEKRPKQNASDVGLNELRKLY